MPLALLVYDPERITSGVAGEIAFILPQFVAAELTVEEEDGQLSPSDIEVRVLPKSPEDIDHYDLSIVIFAQDYPSRRAKLDEARAAIISELEDALPLICDESDCFTWYPPRIKGFVWVLLCPGSFGEFEII